MEEELAAAPAAWLVDERLVVVDQQLALLRRHLDNVKAAEVDGVGWVVKDNAAWAREAAGRMLVAAARVYAAAEALEDLALERAVSGATPPRG